MSHCGEAQDARTAPTGLLTRGRRAVWEVPAAGPYIPSAAVWEPALDDEFEASSL